MPDLDSHRRAVHEHLMDLGPDPFADVYEASQRHREEHGPACGVYPSNPVGMRFKRVLARATRPNRLLEVGSGLGYSALHLASAAGPDAKLTSIERDTEHVALAEQNVAKAGLAGRVQFITGEAVDLIPALEGPYDFVYDDGWFAKEPPYLELMIDLLRPGALLVMANWFLLEDAITNTPRNDWASFAGPTWADDVKVYARKLVAHPRLEVSFLALVAVGVKVA